VRHAFRVAAALAVLAVAGCSTAPRTPTPVPRATTAPRPLTLYALQGREVRLAHVGKSTTPTVMATVVSGGKPVGDVQPLPDVLSDHHQTTLVEAETLYGKAGLRAALAALEPAYPRSEQPLRARGLRPSAVSSARAHPRLRRLSPLVDLLDAEWRSDAPAAVTVDVWFVDAYWKVGTLHIDRAEWERAAFEISRALAAAACGSAWPATRRCPTSSGRTTRWTGATSPATMRRRALERKSRNMFAKRYLDRCRATASSASRRTLKGAMRPCHG